MPKILQESGNSEGIPPAVVFGIIFVVYILEKLIPGTFYAFISMVLGASFLYAFQCRSESLTTNIERFLQKIGLEVQFSAGSDLSEAKQHDSTSGTDVTTTEPRPEESEMDESPQTIACAGDSAAATAEDDAAIASADGVNIAYLFDSLEEKNPSEHGADLTDPSLYPKHKARMDLLFRYLGSMDPANPQASKESASVQNQRRKLQRKLLQRSVQMAGSNENDKANNKKAEDKQEAAVDLLEDSRKIEALLKELGEDAAQTGSPSKPKLPTQGRPAKRAKRKGPVSPPKPQQPPPRPRSESRPSLEGLSEASKSDDASDAPDEAAAPEHASKPKAPDRQQCRAGADAGEYEAGTANLSEPVGFQVVATRKTRRKDRKDNAPAEPEVEVAKAAPSSPPKPSRPSPPAAPVATSKSASAAAAPPKAAAPRSSGRSWNMDLIRDPAISSTAPVEVETPDVAESPAAEKEEEEEADEGEACDEGEGRDKHEETADDTADDTATFGEDPSSVQCYDMRGLDARSPTIKRKSSLEATYENEWPIETPATKAADEDDGGGEDECDEDDWEWQCPEGYPLHEYISDKPLQCGSCGDTQAAGTRMLRAEESGWAACGDCIRVAYDLPVSRTADQAPVPAEAIDPSRMTAVEIAAWFQEHGAENSLRQCMLQVMATQAGAVHPN